MLYLPQQPNPMLQLGQQQGSNMMDLVKLALMMQTQKRADELAQLRATTESRLAQSQHIQDLIRASQYAREQKFQKEVEDIYQQPGQIKTWEEGGVNKPVINYEKLRQDLIQSSLRNLPPEKSAPLIGQLKESGFTLGPGQTRYEGGKAVATGGTQVMTPYQTESLDLRRKEIEQREHNAQENRRLREDMFKESMELKKMMFDINTDLRQRVPANVSVELSKKLSALDRYSNLLNSFEDQFGGKVVGGTIGTEIYSRLGWDKPRVNWWKDFKLLDSEIRHELFGATLTGYEKQSWDAVSISENSDPKVIKDVLNNRLKLSKNVLKREVETLEKSGYKPGITIPGVSNIRRE